MPNTIFYKIFFSAAIIFSLLNTQKATAQFFTIKELPQLFKPNLNIRTEYTPNRTVNNDTANIKTYGMFNTDIQATIPLKGKIDIDLNLGKLKNIKDIKSIKDIKNIVNAVPVDVTGYQIFGLASGGMRKSHFGFDSISNRTHYRGMLGILGIHLLPQTRLLVYSASLIVEEEPNTFKNLNPQLNAMVGMVKLYDLKFIYYYGGFLNYANGHFLPIPFVGATFVIPPFLDAQIILPAQIEFSYRAKRGTRLAIGAYVNGFSQGFANSGTFWNNTTNTPTRLDFFNQSILLKGTLDYKINPKSRLSAEFGAPIYRKLIIEKQNTHLQTYKPKNSAFFAATYTVDLSQKSLFKSLIEKTNLHIWNSKK